MTAKFVRVCLLGFLLMLLSSAANATTAVQFVSPTDGSNSNNGLTWTTPVLTVMQAITNLPAEGGYVWVASSTGVAVDLHNVVTGGVQQLDPGTKSVTLYLGCSPFSNSYTVGQIVLENNFHLIGCGSGSSNGTIIKSNDGAVPLVVLGQSGPVLGVELKGFRLEGASSNNSGGIYISAPAGGGLWYSMFEDIQIGVTTKFEGTAMEFNASATGAVGLNQFISLRDVRAYRDNNSSLVYACDWNGSNGQFVIDNVECDGTTEAGTNVNIASASSTQYPYSLSFNELTDQDSAIAVNIAGAVSITFHQAHLENDKAGFLLSLGTGGAGVNTYDITIEDSEFATVGSNSGLGYLAETTTGPLNSSLNFIHNRVGNPPDQYLVGFTTNLVEEGTFASNVVYRPSAFPGLTVNGSANISGNLVVTGSKSAKVSLPDGRSVAYYAVESPENWFEDFGTGQLKKGTAVVKLDPDFINSVNSNMKYSVYITPDGPCGDLYVSKKTATQFEIRQAGHSTCSASFDYRIVARRRGFEKIRMEELKPSVQ
jgi:hypothetical protein